MDKLPFSPADILLPRTGHEAWASIACDQFTSEPGYWQEAEKAAGDQPSCLRITLPEVYLGAADVDGRLAAIRQTMNDYLNADLFEEYRDALILVERTLRDGRVRRGIVGKFDLSAYSYEAGAKPLIRPTEGTVLSRIPPRVKVRRDAPLELPHVMILIDDKRRTVLEPIRTEGLTVLYDFDLMTGGGHLRGYLLPKNEQERILQALGDLAAPAVPEDEPLLFAVGDGNHSLATAKACAELIGTPEAGYALAEIVNIHDEALDFEPIYRVLFGVDPLDVVREVKKVFPNWNGRRVDWVSAAGEGHFFVPGLETKDLQDFLDAYAASHPGSVIDYIHGEDSLRTLAGKPESIGFLFGGITKDELFPYVKANGPLPRKTFSMGEALDKRFYMECRKIR